MLKALIISAVITIPLTEVENHFICTADEWKQVYSDMSDCILTGQTRKICENAAILDICRPKNPDQKIRILRPNEIELAGS